MTNASDMKESSSTYKKQYPKRGGKYLDPKADLTSKALSIVEKSAMTEQQLEAYDKFWMSVFDEEAISEGRYLEGRAEEKTDIARKMKADGMPKEIIAKYTGLTVEEIERVI